MSTYNEIRSLVNKLESHRVAERRDAVTTLRSRLALVEVRSRLAHEASTASDVAGQVKQRRALSQLWRYVIMTAVISTEKFVNTTKAKLTADDFTFPFALVRNCCMPYDNTPDPPGFRPYHPSLLSEKEVKLVLKYCDSLLQNERALELAEGKIMEHLAFLASRKEFVAYMRPRVEIQWIVEEIEARLLDDTMDQAIQKEAAIVFENLTITRQTLGIASNLLIPGCVKMVAQCCANHSNVDDGRVRSMFSHLCNGLATLLESDLDQAIAPLSRHGRPILSFVKKSYFLVVGRHAFHRYLFSHLLAAERAGELQGHMPGELGDLGKASLTGKQISALMSLLLEDRFKREREIRMSDQDHFQLMLLARLFKPAQRMYLEATMWTMMDDPMEDMKTMIQNASFQSDQFRNKDEATIMNSLSSSLLAKSPFIEGIISQLCPLLSMEVFTACDLPVLGELFSGAQSNVNAKDVVASLDVITACAKACPTGACWTSSLGNWQSLRCATDFGLYNKSLCVNDSESRIESMYCTTSDLRLLVTIVGNILEWSGVSGNENVLRSSLACLCSLTTTTALILSSSHELEGNFLRNEWRRIWSFVVRPDSRFSREIKDVSSGSTGQLILSLLREMIRCFCLDPAFASSDSPTLRRSTFLYSNQSDVWRLPAFSSHSYGSLGIFSLLHTILCVAGLDENEGDFIENNSDDYPGGAVASRRSKLLLYCLKVLSNDVPDPVVAAAAACCSALVNGLATMGSLSQLGNQQNTTLVEDNQNQNDLYQAFQRDFLLLWDDPVLDPRVVQDNHGALLRGMCAPFIEDEALRRVQICMDGRLCFTDFVSETTRQQLIDLLSSFYSKRLATFNSLPQGTDENEELNSELLSNVLLSLKCQLTIRLLCGWTEEVELLSICGQTASVLRFIRSNYSFLGDNTNIFSSVFTSILCIIRCITSVANRKTVALPRDLLDETVNLFESCKKLFEDTQSINIEKKKSIDEGFWEDDLTGDSRSPGTASLRGDLGSEESQTRKRAILDQRRSSRKRLACEARLPHSRCTILIAEILWTCNPRPDIAENIIKRLMGVKNFDSTEVDALDLMGAAASLNLLCKKEPLVDVKDPDFLFDSIGMVLKIRTLIQLAMPDDDFYNFGATYYDNIVAVRDMKLGLHSMTKEEAKHVVEILVDGFRDPEPKSGSRPYWRAGRLLSGIKAFRYGGNIFHNAFDKDFANKLVLPSIYDQNFLVRKVASKAVASAIRLLRNEKVIESVRKRLPALGFGALENYKTWYLSIPLATTLGVQDVTEHQVWEDAFLSMQESSLSCWCEIAGMTLSAKVLSQCLFDLVSKVGSDPAGEGKCFLAFQNVAKLRGLPDVESLLEICILDIIILWVDNGLRLLDFPLTIASPSLLRQLMYSGHYKRCLVTKNDTHSFYLTIRKYAATKFVAQYSRIVVPQLTLKLTKKYMAEARTLEWRRAFIEEPSIRELCLAQRDHVDDIVVQRLIESNFAGFIALISLVLCDSNCDETTAGGFERFFRSFVPKTSFASQCASNYEPAARLLLEISISYDSISSERFLLAHQELSRLTSVQFSASSLLLLFYSARILLKKRVASLPLEEAWIPMDYVLRVGLTNLHFISHSDYPVKLVFDSLTTMLVDNESYRFRANSIRSLHFVAQEVPAVVQEYFYSDSLDHLLDSITELCDEVVDALEREDNLMKKCCTRSNCSYYASGCLPFVAPRVSFATNQNSDRSEFLESSLLFLTFVARNSKLNKRVEARVINVFKIRRLETASTFASPQAREEFVEVMNALTQGDDENRSYHVGRPDIVECFDQLLTIQRLNASVNSTATGNMSRIYRSKMLQCLHRLETSLISSQQTKASLKPVHAFTLVQAVLPLSHRHVRIAASRCLGALDLSTVKWDVVDDDKTPHFWVFSAVDSNRFNRHLQARCLEALLETTTSGNPFYALIATETLNALLSTRVGHKACECVEEKQAGTLVGTFLKDNVCDDISLDSSLMITKREVEALKLQIGISCTHETWCFSEGAWRPSTLNAPVFDDWLRSIVAALLFYNFQSEESCLSSNDDAIFFKFCQRACFSNSNLAKAIFPALVSSMINAEGDMGHPSTLERNGIVEQLSSCFKALLHDCTHGAWASNSENKPFLSLVIETLDLLRLSSQARFILRRNQGRKGQTPLKSPHELAIPTIHDNVVQRAINWHGLRFGVTLELNGLLVAQACLEADKPALALLYAELYADSRYGGSTSSKSVITQLSSQRGAQEISLGNGNISGMESSTEGVTYPEQLCSGSQKFLHVVRECYLKLEEHAEELSVARFISDLELLNPAHSAIWLETNGTSILQLAHDDSGCSSNSVAEGLDRLGLKFTLENFVSGALTRRSVVNSGEESREKWHKCRLLRICWSHQIAGREGFEPALVRNGVFYLDADHRGFWELLHQAAIELHNCDYNSSRAHAEEARWAIISSAGHSLSTMSQITNLSARCKAINDIVSFTEKKMDSLQWASNQDLCYLSSKQRELPMSIRELLLRHCMTKAKRERVDSKTEFLLLMQHLWDTSLKALGDHDLVTATGTLRRIQLMLASDPDFLQKTDSTASATLQLRLHEARLLECSGDFSAAIRNMKGMIDNLRDRVAGLSFEEKGLLSEAMILCGHWMTKHKTDPSRSILSSYLTKGKEIALDVLKSNQTEVNNKRASRALIQISSVAYSTLDNVLSKQKSFSYQQSQEILDLRKNELRDCITIEREMAASLKRERKGKQDGEILKEHTIYRSNLTKEVNQMESEQSDMRKSVDTYLRMTLLSIFKALELIGVRNNGGLTAYVYRMVSVWFSAVDDQRYTKAVDDIIADAIDNIPSFRFVPLANQLFARVDKSLDNESYLRRVNDLILKLCVDHPYHCLIHLIAACNGTKVGKGVDGRSADAFIGNTGEGKIQAAKDMVHALQLKDPVFLRGLLESYTVLSNAYIQLAEKDIQRSPEKKQIRFAGLGLKEAERLDTCLRKRPKIEYPPCILTKPPNIRPGLDYGEGREDPKNSERVVNFEGWFEVTAGGVHQPKIVVCHGSKGGRYRQLVKGQDEIRQDAVMQQVFGIVNEFSAQEKQRKENAAQGSNTEVPLITYTIVPLTPTSGVLEWVENSVPFGDLIVESKRRVGLHPKYFPGEWKSSQCREKLKDAKRENKQEAFDIICSYYSPSFRYFFLEKFGHAAEKWCDAKLRYSRSVAVSSLVGHVLGIGDRHCSNILVHENSGEVVHIDFGIVFEQGKLLALPERVPFRLTRNVVDGMGIMGTDGVFFSAAVSTMNLLRDNSNALLTILSAIANDPLYKWRISPRRHANLAVVKGLMDDTDFEGKNEAARRAISRVHEKLQGYEDGTAGEQQSVESQVQLLVNQARDHSNLCNMFYGWQPWV